MTVFVDTSAILAGLDASDDQHVRAIDTWRNLIQADTPVLTTNYVLLETIAVLQHRGGLIPVRRFVDDLLPALHVYWISEADHRAAVTALLAADRRQLSLVDCTSFLIMRRLDLPTAFAFDPHFVEQGFHCLPPIA